MKTQPDYLWLFAAALFFYLGYKQFYVAKHVAELERTGRVTNEAAARIRRKPMRLIGCACIVGGMGFLLLAFVRL
ncbi:MAG TPA: hypothetical protein VM940_14530 [Chthoniobacterales bacterium]|jgi:hypothetical protein|nr:hypothetical protein [Chthoniobacterales bacterium]